MNHQTSLSVTKGSGKITRRMTLLVLVSAIRHWNPHGYSPTSAPAIQAFPVRPNNAVTSLAYIKSIITRTSAASMTGNPERRNIIIIGSPPSYEFAIK